jgi:hypothetical protein
MNISKAVNYNKDFYLWALQTAQLIRENKFNEIDKEHVAEEIESMGKSDKRELVNRFALLLAHLLKWMFQPERRGNSWKYTIKEQRFEIAELLEDSPSLKKEIDAQLGYAYQKALVIAIKETGLAPDTFPENCPFTFEETLDHNFLPAI